MSRVIDPKKPQLEIAYKPGPLADPAEVFLPGPNGGTLLIVGGQTSYERSVMMVAVQLACQDTGEPSPSCDEIAKRAIEVVDAVRNAMAKKQADLDKLEQIKKEMAA